ncbi:MAG: hypothetical protein HW397_493 [Dehalococcoidia bacterium]|nr:hypothetical protein [Dehalococcoidia bacterium]
MVLCGMRGNISRFLRVEVAALLLLAAVFMAACQADLARIPPSDPMPTAQPVASTSGLLTIGEPAQQSIVRVSPITIRGLTRPYAAVSVNGELAQADASGNFSQRVALEEGANIFDIIATDGEGNEGALELIVFFQPEG